MNAGDTLYDALIDTTFAVYDQHANVPDAAGKIAWYLSGVRVGGTFAATHVPWLCFATTKYMCPAERDFVGTHKNEWSTTGKLARMNANERCDVCMGARR